MWLSVKELPKMSDNSWNSVWWWVVETYVSDKFYAGFAYSLSVLWNGVHVKQCLMPRWWSLSILKLKLFYLKDEKSEQWTGSSEWGIWWDLLRIAEKSLACSPVSKPLAGGGGLGPTAPISFLLIAWSLSIVKILFLALAKLVILGGDNKAGAQGPFLFLLLVTPWAVLFWLYQHSITCTSWCIYGANDAFG